MEDAAASSRRELVSCFICFSVSLVSGVSLVSDVEASPIMEDAGD